MLGAKAYIHSVHFSAFWWQLQISCSRSCHFETLLHPFTVLVSFPVFKLGPDPTLGPGAFPLLPLVIPSLPFSFPRALTKFTVAVFCILFNHLFFFLTWYPFPQFSPKSPTLPNSPHQSCIFSFLSQLVSVNTMSFFPILHNTYSAWVLSPSC